MWQYLIVAVAVLAAFVFLVRYYLLRPHKIRSGCGSAEGACGSCRKRCH